MKNNPLIFWKEKTQLSNAAIAEKSGTSPQKWAVFYW